MNLIALSSKMQSSYLWCLSYYIGWNIVKINPPTARNLSAFWEALSIWLYRHELIYLSLGTQFLLFLISITVIRKLTSCTPFPKQSLVLSQFLHPSTSDSLIYWRILEVFFGHVYCSSRGTVLPVSRFFFISICLT